MKKLLEYNLVTRDSTVGHWRFKQNLSDESEKNNDLVSVGIEASHYQNGYSEEGVTAIVFPSSAVYAKINSDDASDFDMGMDSFSIEVIFKASDTQLTALIDKIIMTTFKGWRFVSAGAITVLIGDGTNSVTINSGVDVGDGNWHYCVCTIDRENNEGKIFVDGSQSGSTTDISSVTGNISIPSRDFRIQTTQADVFIDEICISKEVLTPAAIADRAKGRMVEVSEYQPGFLRRYLPSINHDNDNLLEFLIPFTSQYLELKQLGDELSNLVVWHECPERYLSHIASMFNFELIDIPFATEEERRNFLKNILWIYKRKGTISAIDKIISLLGVTGSYTEEYSDWGIFKANLSRTFDKDLIDSERFVLQKTFDESTWVRKLKIQLTGAPAYHLNKFQYLQNILYQYVPPGVVIEWVKV